MKSVSKKIWFRQLYLVTNKSTAEVWYKVFDNIKDPINQQVSFQLGKQVLDALYEIS